MKVYENIASSKSVLQSKHDTAIEITVNKKKLLDIKWITTAVKHFVGETFITSTKQVECPLFNLFLSLAVSIVLVLDVRI